MCFKGQLTAKLIQIQMLMDASFIKNNLANGRWNGWNNTIFNMYEALPL